MLGMMVDSVFEPKTEIVADIARIKNKKAFDLLKHMQQFDPNVDAQDILMKTAYGLQTLGMPRMGLERNVENINSELLNTFIGENINPSKCVIAANGVKNHDEFVQLVQ